MFVFVLYFVRKKLSMSIVMQYKHRYHNGTLLSSLSCDTDSLLPSLTFNILDLILVFLSRSRKLKITSVQRGMYS